MSGMSVFDLSRHIYHLTGVNSSLLDTSLHTFDHDIPYCASCRGCQYNNAHMYGAYEAERWNNKYIYYCPKGLIFLATQKPRSSFTLITGPIVMEECDFDAAGIPVLTTRAVGSLSEIIAECLWAESEFSEEDLASQSDLLNMMYEISCDFDNSAAYPLEYETQLEQLVMMGDKQGASEILNRLMGYIYFSSHCDFDTIKSRTIEIIVILSRAIIKSGAEASEIFTLNSGYIRQVENFNDIDSLSMWLIKVAHKFIGYVFDLKYIKHKDIIYKLSSYVKNNYQSKLSLSDAAAHVYLSRSYLSKLLKDELGCTFTEYVNAIRIAKSKELLKNSDLPLVDISNTVGFEDQSYFTKVFKKTTGVSPGKYREQRLNL